LEDELFEHLRHTDTEAYLTAKRIDKKQDKIIAEIWDISFTVGTENQKSNSFWKRYDPKHMQEVLEEKRKRLESQMVLFKGGENIEKRGTEPVAESDQQRFRIPNTGDRQSERSFDESFGVGMEFVLGRRKSGEGITVPHRSA